jgi:hypothetical protein
MANYKHQYIQTIDDNGDSKNLTPKGWSKITGRPERSIISAYSNYRRGHGTKTLREVVGFGLGKKEETAMSRFLKTRLVGV